MSEAPMTRARFESLADAYGGEVARWPAAEREAAALLMSAEPEFVRRVLAQAEGLDAVLDGWRSGAASPELVERILASAPRPRVRRFAWLSPAALAAGLAAACAAGVIVGVELSARSASQPASQAGTEQVAATNSMSLEPSLDLEGA